MSNAPPCPAAVRRDLAALDRRAFLRLAGLGAVAGLLPGCSDAPPPAAPPADLALRHLTPRGYAVLNAAAGSFAGPRGAALVRAGGLDPARAAEGFLAASPELAGPLAGALLVLEFAVWPVVPKLRPFTAQNAAARHATLRALLDSRLALARVVYHGVRSIALLSFYGAVSEQSPPDFGLGQIPPGVALVDAVAESPS